MPGKWIPEVGKLVVRQSLGVGTNDLLLAFHNNDNDPTKMFLIAEARDFVAKANFGPWVEYVLGESEVVGNGTLVVRRLATDNDLLFFLRCWNNQYGTLARWLDGIQGFAFLADEEKTRIRRLAAIK